ncbi:Leucine rich repeat containing protein [Gracilaria domingensis]|nr:Leucine rich repeat containing protein [Gracilaria domingensis]
MHNSNPVDPLCAAPPTHDLPACSASLNRSPAQTPCGPLPRSDSVQALVSFVNTSPSNAPAAPSARPVIRALDTHARPHTVNLTDQTDNISLSGLSLHTVALTALATITHRLRDLSLSANALPAIDLGPLAYCPSLTVLTLNSNRISSIDLSPLASCPQLERLWLHDNNLHTVDLSPLRQCKALRSLYLEDNSIHEKSIDLSPLTATTNLRSLRLGGNRLSGKLDLTPLLKCPSLSVFSIDTSVSLVANGDSSQARVSSALRRIVLDINFSGNRGSKFVRLERGRTTPPVMPKSSSPTRPRRKVNPPVAPTKRSVSPRDVHRARSPSPAKPAVEHVVVKVLLIGFRRLARYAVEDALNKCGNVIIRAADNGVVSHDPEKIRVSDVVLLYAPPERILNQLSALCVPTAVAIIGSERYRCTMEAQVKDLFDQFSFHSDPINEEATSGVYQMGRKHALASLSSPKPSTNQKTGTTPSTSTGKKSGARKDMYSDLKCTSVDIELEHIDDDGESSTESNSISSGDSLDALFTDSGKKARRSPTNAASLSGLSRRLRERAGRSGRSFGNCVGGEMRAHGKIKERAERASVEAAFEDVGGYGTVDSFAGIARACGLPKCAGPLLFRAACGSSFEIESTTPEAGVPNHPMEGKNRRVSTESFMTYWSARLRAFDGEERLANVLEDSVGSNLDSEDEALGHSQYGAPLSRKSSGISSPSSSFSRLNCLPPSVSADFLRTKDINLANIAARFPRSASMSSIPTDISCPCDSGVESLIRAFMDGRRSRFGSFALVKMPEAVAIGSALVIHGLRARSKSRVGGEARPVCPKEVREGKLNASLIAAEVGIFEGVASGLSMDQIRSVKGCFATEVAPGQLSRNGGVALNCTLGVEDVQRFCVSRKTLLPGAVKLAMSAHCRNPKRMTLAEFSILLSVLNNISSNGAVDYMFTIIDVDRDDRWTIPDLRQLHMEKEQIWLQDGMAVSELGDIWTHLIDMIRPFRPTEGITRREFYRLGPKERKAVIQSLLFMDDDLSLLNIRRTVELNKNSPSPLAVM